MNPKIFPKTKNPDKGPAEGVRATGHGENSPSKSTTEEDKESNKPAHETPRPKKWKSFSESGGSHVGNIEGGTVILPLIKRTKPNNIHMKKNYHFLVPYDGPDTIQTLSHVILTLGNHLFFANEGTG